MERPSSLLGEIAAALEQAAALLQRAAELARVERDEVCGPNGAPSAAFIEPEWRRSLERPFDEELAGLVATTLVAHWSGEDLGPTLTVGDHEIDLATPQGKWELLILAVLKGARVRDAVVQETFLALVERGLTDLELLASRSSAVRAAVAEVLRETYRALGRKEAKVEALMENAARVVEEYGGDLDRLYHRTGGDDAALIRELQRFKQVGAVAHWYCRTLKVHGVWPDVGGEATRFFDRYTDMPLVRLGLIGEDEAGPPARLGERFVDLYLDGDATPLYLQGLLLCSQNRPVVCLAECPLHSRCLYVENPNEF